MKFHQLQFICEASYKGNIGMMEMFKFYNVATPEEKAHMKSLIENGQQEQAWAFLKKVTGTALV